MPDVPDEFLDKWAEGSWPSYAAEAWAKEEGHWDTIREYMDEGLSEEWAFAALDQDIPGVSEWDAITISRDEDGSWDVIIHDKEGETYIVDAAANDSMAGDNIFSDLEWELMAEYDIDVERDIDYSGE